MCLFFSGIDTFKGKYFHSRDYKAPEEWRNKTAVVIGLGNSGGDIAVELSRVTKQVVMTELQKYRADICAWIVCTFNMLNFIVFVSHDNAQSAERYEQCCSLTMSKTNQQ